MPDELNGVIVVDKPEGISSAGVVARVKRLFGARKAGHTGTLDPFATGVLVCCLNQATRISRFLLEGDKAYEAELVLGLVTDTQDATGTVVSRHPVTGITDRDVRETAATFVGLIDQVPPIYSALKHRGTPLYKLARRGEAVEKPARPVRIHRLDVLAVELPVVRFAVSCSAGTYIRTLCADIGQRLGCGGHLGRLRRTASGGFTAAEALGLDALEQRRENGTLDQAVVPMNAALSFMPAVPVDAHLAGKIRNGFRLDRTVFPAPQTMTDGGVFRVVDARGRLLAVIAESPAGDYNYCCVFSA